MSQNPIGDEDRRSAVVRVRNHDDALRMAAAVNVHLSRYPHDAPLFMLDYLQGVSDLGFHLSPPMRTHLEHQFGGRSQEAKAAYAHIKGTRSPSHLRLRLPVPEGCQPFDIPRQGPLCSASAVGLLGLEAVPASNALLTSTVNPANAAGYSVVIQLADTLLNRIVKAFFRSGAMKTSWAGIDRYVWHELDLEFTFKYEVALTIPNITVPGEFSGAIALTVGAKAKLALDATILEFLNPTRPELQDFLSVELDFQFRVVVAPIIKNVGPGLAAVVVDLKAIDYLELSLDGTSLPADLAKFIEELLTRIARHHLAEQGDIPISFEFDALAREGVPIVSLAAKAIPAAGGSPASVSIAIDTTGNGNIQQLSTFIPPGNGFAMIVSKVFMIDQLWGRQRSNVLRQVNDKTDEIEIDNISLGLEDGSIGIVVRFHKRIDCLPDIDGTATAHVAFEAYQDNGIWGARLKSTGNPDIKIDDGDRFIYEFLLGFLVSLLLPGSGILWTAIMHAVVDALISNQESDAAGKIAENAIGFHHRIPNTNITVVATTPIAPVIYSNGVSLFGDAEFR